MAAHVDKNGDAQARINNYRPTKQAKEMLREIKIYRASLGQFFSENQLFIEAVFGYFGPELERVRKLKTKKSIRAAKTEAA